MANAAQFRRSDGTPYTLTWKEVTQFARIRADDIEPGLRALEGELAQLERAWREAEEIAAIADSLLLPEHTDEFLDRHSPRSGVSEPS